MGKNVFITGAAGFIGFHLARQLVLRGDKVIGYDNVNDYYPPQLKRMRMQELQKEGITIIEGDICDAAALTENIRKHHTTHVVHLAAQAGVRYSLENPQAYVKANLEGFVNILEVCRLHPSIKLTYASSSSVYGRNTKVPFAESDRTDMQASLYGVTKKSNELMAGTYHHLYKIPVTGLRFFTVYGPWGRPDMAYYTFTKAILSGEPIPVYNHGYMERDFTYIDDIIRGTIAAIDLGAACEVFNLGNHRPVKLLDFIAILEKSLGAKAILKPMEMQAGDVVATYADISHSFDKLGFTPQVPLEEGIPLFVNWYKSYQSAANHTSAAKTQQKN
jgi:UDP-glucuronate 4-epimerase